MIDNGMTQRAPAFLFSGEPLFFLDPTRTRIRPEDVNKNLSNLCRYNGGMTWSVMQHTLLCYALAEVHEMDKALFPYIAGHDFAETYTGDLPTGLKQVVPGWAEIEEAWEAHVHQSLGLMWPVPADIHKWVKFIDHRALVIETTMFGWPDSVAIAESKGGLPTRGERIAYLRVSQGKIGWDDIRALFPDWE